MSAKRNIISTPIRVLGVFFCVLLQGTIDLNAQNINSMNKRGPLETQINTLTGNFYLARTDMFIPGRILDIDVSFSYNSYKSGTQRGYGKGWSFEYDIHYKNVENSQNITIGWGNGRDDLYEATGTTTFAAPKGFFTKLEIQGGNPVLTESDGWKYYFENPSHKRVTKIEEPNGNNITFNYSDTLLTSIVSTSGQTVQFQYNSNGWLTSATDVTATPNITFTYQYNQAGYLTSVTDPLDGAYVYTYLINGPMKTLSDKNNNTVNIIYYPNFSVREIVGCNKRISASYDAVGMRTSITDHMDDGSPNQVTTYAYEVRDNFRWLKSIKGNCCGFDKQYTYDESGNIIEEVDGNGNVWKYTYDARGNMTRVTNPEGNYEQYTYSTDYNNVTSIRDFNGYITTMEYDANGNITKITEPENVVYQANYDEHGNLLSSTDPKGNVYTYIYNVAGQPIEINGPSGFTTFLSYDTRGNLLSFTDGNGNEISAEYDILNRLKKINDALDNTSNFQYDAAGNLTTYTNPDNKSYGLSYDASNRLTRYTNPANKSYALSYTSMDSLRTLIDPLGNTSTYAYDEQNRLVAFEDALGNIDRYSYDDNGNLIEVTSHTGLVIKGVYDSLNQLIRMEDSESEIVSYSYDVNGNLVSVTNSQGGTVLAKYDRMNRLVRITNELGQSVAFTYDSNSNITKIVDENNKESFFTYDDRDRIVSYTDPLGGTISITYDQVGRHTSITDQNGNTTHYTYDENNRQLRMTFPNGSYKEYTYDAVSRATAERLSDGSVITYTYNELNQVVTKNLPNGETVSYTYDDVGRILTATNSAGTVTFAYDALGRVTSETFGGRTVSYSYNDAGRTQTTVYPDNSEVIREFDARGRLIKVSKDDVLLASYAYSSENMLGSKAFGNGVTSTYQYDFANRLSRISTSSNIQESTFTYDKFGNKLSVNRTNRPQWSEQMTYDDNSRLVSHTKGSAQNQFTYDALGNRLSANLNGTTKTYTANNLNQMTSIDGTTLTYDGRGNMTFDGTYHKFYDPEGLLVKDSLNPSNVFTYSYDALGRRVSKTHAGTTIWYTNAGPIQIEERTSSNDLINQVIYADFLDPVMSLKDGNTYYYHNDDLGSIEAITNAAGQPVEFYSYDTYGTPSVYGSNLQPLSASAIGNRLGFTGQEYDPVTNSYRFYFRNYSPELGVFTQRDLIEYGDGMGMYQYVGNNPANGIDIWGLCDEESETSTTVRKILKTTAQFITGQIISNVTFYKLTGELTIPAVLTGVEKYGPSWASSRATRLRAGGARVLGKLSSGVRAAGGRIVAGVRAAGGMVARGAGTVAAGGATATVAIAGAGAVVVGGVGLMAIDNWEQSQEFDALQNIRDAERYMWEQGATDEEKVERILKLSKIRKEQQEREKRKRRNKKNPCDDGTQDPEDPDDSDTEYLSLMWSLDPNEIVGPAGVEEPKWISSKNQMPYTIYCENDVSATAPARRIRIITPVEEHQDPTTLQLGSFGFNNMEFEIPPGNNSYYTRLDWRDSLGVYVDVLAGYDAVKNQVFWDFIAIDPITLLPSEDPTKGVLLMQDSVMTQYGHGFVNFVMKPRSTAQTTDVIAARAEIIFDDNEMIPTNIHTNTLDASPPQSSITSATTPQSNQVSLQWSGNDGASGAGIRYYTLYTSPDGINYSALASRTTNTDTSFVINNDGNYCFFVLATDKVGHVEELDPAKVVCLEVSVDPLPVTWLYFDAVNSGNNNLLNWATANEVNSQEFVVERSLDGKKFVQIEIVPAKGESSKENEYHYTDENVNHLHSNIIYYRLKQIDADGEFTYTHIVSVRIPVSKVTARSIVFPNPTSNLINIRVGDPKMIKTDAQLFDINGKAIRKLSIGSQTTEVDLNDLPSGIYILRLSNGETLRIIKQ